MRILFAFILTFTLAACTQETDNPQSDKRSVAKSDGGGGEDLSYSQNQLPFQDVDITAKDGACEVRLMSIKIYSLLGNQSQEDLPSKIEMRTHGWHYNDPCQWANDKKIEPVALLDAGNFTSDDEPQRVWFRFQEMQPGTYLACAQAYGRAQKQNDRWNKESFYLWGSMMFEYPVSSNYKLSLSMKAPAQFPASYSCKAGMQIH